MRRRRTVSKGRRHAQHDGRPRATSAPPPSIRHQRLTDASIGAIFREVPVFIATMIAVLLAVTLLPEFALMLPRLTGYGG
jgi:hypothetical protein